MAKRSQSSRIGKTAPSAENSLNWEHGHVSVCGSDVKWTLAIPNELSSNALVMFIPGFGGIKRSSRSFRNANAQLNGVATLSYEPARHDNESIIRNIQAPQNVHAKTIGAVLLDAQNTIRTSKLLPRSTKKTMFERQQFKAHSMGGLAATQYAQNHVSEIESIDYLASAGLGSPTIGQLMETIPKNGVRAITHELIPLVSPKTIVQIMSYYLKHPDRTYGEARSCLTADIRPDVSDLTDQGISTSYLAFEHDMLIPPNPNIANHVDNYGLMYNAGHLAPQVFPVDTIVALSNLRTPDMQLPNSSQLIAA